MPDHEPRRYPRTTTRPPQASRPAPSMTHGTAPGSAGPEPARRMPDQNADAATASAHPPTSHRDPGLDVRELLVADPGHVPQILDGSNCSMLFAIVDDPLGQGRPDGRVDRRGGTAHADLSRQRAHVPEEDAADDECTDDEEPDQLATVERAHPLADLFDHISPPGHGPATDGSAGAGDAAREGN